MNFHHYDFHEKLTVSKGIVKSTCLETIRGMIPGCSNVVANEDVALDKQGVDYVATLRKGAKVLIDHKHREPCKQHWQRSAMGILIAEIALEIWSVVEAKRIGWTLDESKLTDYTLHTFAPDDTDECWLLPFQLLRAAFHKNYQAWTARYKRAKQQSSRGSSNWTSECVFVPVTTVVDAINAAMVSEVVICRIAE